MAKVTLIQISRNKIEAGNVSLKVTEDFVFGEAPAYVARRHSLYGGVQGNTVPNLNPSYILH